MVAVFKLFEYHKDLGSELIHSVKESVHELLGHFVPTLQELLPDPLQEELGVCVLDPDVLVPQ